MSIDLLLYVAFVVCEGLAAAGIQSRINLTALGLAFFGLSFII